MKNVHPRKSDTVTDLAALPEPIEFASRAKLSHSYALVEEWGTEKMAPIDQEAEAIAAEMAELRSIDIDDLRTAEQLMVLVDRATALINRAHAMKVYSLRELGKILDSIPKEQHKGLFALANLPAALRRRLSLSAWRNFCK